MSDLSFNLWLVSLRTRFFQFKLGSWCIPYKVYIVSDEQIINKKINTIYMISNLFKHKKKIIIKSGMYLLDIKSSFVIVITVVF
jgi:hypothetical protein